MMDLNAAAADVQELVEVVGRSAAVVVMMPPAKGPASDAIATLFASMKAKQVSTEQSAGNEVGIMNVRRMR